MELVKGQIVRSIAGHDKGDFFIVTNVDGAFATICDGKHRPVERQKKKKLIHLAVTTVIVTMSSNQTNREIKKLLRQFKENKNMIS